MKIIKQVYLINSTVEKVWEALTNPKVIDKWGGGPAKMSDKPGKFSLWGGDIYGTNTKVVKNKLLEQDWFSEGFEKASKVIFMLSKKDGKTELKLVHTNVPDKEIKDIDEGWRTYYIEPLRELLEQ